MSKTLDDEISSLLKTVVDHFDKEDRSVRERQIRHWRRLKLYWNSFSQIYWSETAKDYRIAGSDTSYADSDQDYYDRPVNVFRAFLETIIAALSVQVPGVQCIPDDAENPNDLSTAKAGKEISDLIYRHNNAIYLWLHALYIHCTEGMLACYSYPKSDKSYGTYDKPKYEDKEEESYVCPNCGAQIADEQFSQKEMNEFQPDDDDVELHSEIIKSGPVCPQCAIELDPALQKSKLIITRLIGNTQEPKSRICLEVYGGLYVKVANYAKDQAGTPYLQFAYETHYANALEKYPKAKEKFSHSSWSNIGVNDPYEQYGRLNPQYRGEFPLENVTIKNTWLRPASFNILKDEDYKKLKKKFPDGAKVVMINDTVVDYENESLDDCWTLSCNPIADFVNFDPLGNLLTNIQDITNDLISLTLQTIEHGIPQTLADPQILNFNGQSQIEAIPGSIIRAKSSPNKPMGDYFFQLKTASLSSETFTFYQIIQQLGQFVSGALPSLFGGQQTGGDRTASEYSMSRAQALQRLQTPWKMISLWWKDIMTKSINMYIVMLRDEGYDERLVKKDANGNFLNAFIRREEIQGKIGSIELETDGQIPVSLETQADMIMQLFSLNNAEIQGALIAPENIDQLRKAVRINDFVLPGEDDRQKQYEEINELINSTPIPNPIPVTAQQILVAKQQGQTEPQPQMGEASSVQPDVDVDNHQIEAAICRSWLISEAGRLAKIENPNGYKNVLLHMKEHLQLAMQVPPVSANSSTALTPPQNALSTPPDNAIPPQSDNLINGESDVSAPVH